MKCKFTTLMTALAAAGLCGASVWAANDPASSDQSGQAGQAGQSSQSGQAGQAGQAAQSMPGQAAGAISDAANSALQRIAGNPQDFLQRAYQDNQTEIQLGQLAQQKGQSQQVKDFGQHLVQGHQTLNDKLTQLASQKGIQLDTKLDTRHQMMVDRLSSLSPADFDKQFINEQVMLHRRDVALYQAAADKNTDPDVKSFAQTSVPALREHLQMAQTQASIINEAAGANKPSQSTDQQQQQQQQQPQQNPTQPQQQQQPQQNPTQPQQQQQPQQNPTQPQPQPQQ